MRIGAVTAEALASMPASAAPARAVPSTTDRAERLTTDGAERRIDALLTRIAATRTAEGPEPAAPASPTAPPHASHDRRPADPAPRTGLERLLARGRRENLVPAGPAGAAGGPKFHDAPASGSPRRAGTPAPLGAQGGAPRGMPVLPEEPAAPDDPEALLRTLTDLLRREARSAGVDTGGGH